LRLLPFLNENGSHLILNENYSQVEI
jgi:hypothetical protein